jgi:hypothetical protein
MQELFLENKYTKWYNNIIENAKLKNRQVGTEYYENHHIIPKCMGGKRNRHNEVLLTAKEHYICHLLLIEMVRESSHKTKMAFALHGMRRSHSKGNQRYYSKSYEKTKVRISELTSGKNNPFYGKGHFGKDNHFYGKKHSVESLGKMKETHRLNPMIGCKNPFYGKHHTDETKKKLRVDKSIPIRVIFQNGSVETFESKRQLGLHLGKSKELGLKLNNPKFQHLWKKYNITNIEEIL